jgi:hypothetical protein
MKRAALGLKAIRMISEHQLQGEVEFETDKGLLAISGSVMDYVEPRCDRGKL